MVAYKLLIVENGFIALADIEGYDLSKVMNNDVKIDITSVGFVIKVGKLAITIPERLIDLFLANHVITVYPFSADNYMEEPALTIELARDAIIEAKGVFTFWKKSASAQHQSADRFIN